MHEESSISRAVGSIVRLLPKIPFLKFGDGPEALVLAYRTKGATIEDDECDMDFQALQSGVYQRFRKSSGTTETFTWMRIGFLNETDVRDALIEKLNSMTFVEIESIPLDAGWQTMQWDEAQEKSAARERRTPGR